MLLLLFFFLGPVDRGLRSLELLKFSGKTGNIYEFPGIMGEIPEKFLKILKTCKMSIFKGNIHKWGYNLIQIGGNLP